MKKHPYSPFLALLTALLAWPLTGCVNDDEPSEPASDYGVYLTYHEDGTVHILNSVSDGGVKISTTGQHVTIRSTADDITYFLSGSSTDGSFKIESSAHSQNIVLDNLSLTNPDGGALNIQSKKKTTIVLPEGTQSTLADGGADENDDSKAALFSEGELLFKGKGELTVYGNRRHAICSDDYIELYSGKIRIPSALSDGLHAHDYIVVYDTDLDLTALSDGFDCDRGYIDIYNGNLRITAGSKGIATTSDSAELDRHIAIYGGTIQVQSHPDIEKDLTGYALRSTGDLYIDGGNLTLLPKKKAISAGKSVPISEAPEGTDPSLADEDGEIYVPQNLYITGGTIRATGTVRPQLHHGTQPALYYEQSENYPRNTPFALIDEASGEELDRITSSEKVKRVFFSNPRLAAGSDYSFYGAGFPVCTFPAITTGFNFQQGF